MFPEYRELITRLKAEGTNQRFLHLFEKHNDLDHKISGMELHDAGGVHTEIEALKKEKLRIKDELYSLLRQEAAA
ncbi:DUF465 domain-containing protein [Ottowia sp. GY511]|uniref:YdcH family protein n=1 Tax=Ottowia flava TaxID=2675430 RepID=A0ABW4KPZ1_9BURK|nr:DUF465 domain-containing protein [Ottowia sp. GY511]TXK29510.1 DUF465 domain-containing protein [Ottowia sp. GY511]